MAVLATTKPVAAATVLQRCVCIVLRASAMGNSRKVDLDDIDLKDHETGEDIAGDKGEFRMSKELLDRGELRACAAVIESAKRYMLGMATRSNRIFGSGTYLVPILLVREVDERLKQFVDDLNRAVDKLVERYPEVVERRRVALGKEFRTQDYLSPQDVRHEYSLDWSYVSFQAPEQLEEVDRAIYEQTVAQNETRLADAYDHIIISLRAAALTVFEELAERLGDRADGKPKSLHQTALDDLQRFAALLPKRNIGGDDDLAMVVKQVAAYAEGMDIEMLRKAPAVRSGLAQRAAEAAMKVRGLVSAVSTQRGIAVGGFDADPE